MKRSKPEGLDSFLYKSGILENGSTEEIQNLKQEYWREYKRKWKLEKRKENKLFEILLNRHELTLITKAAKEKQTSPTNYIKTSAISNSKNKNHFNPVKIGILRQILVLHYSSIQTLVEDEKVDSKIGRSLLEEVTKIQVKVWELIDYKLA